MNVLQEFKNKVRVFLKDFKEKNGLLEDIDGNQRVENTDDEIKFAIEAIYNDSCEAPPKRWKIPLSSASKRLWFLYGVVGFLLDMNTFENARNTLPMSDGGVEINPEGFKTTQYANAALLFKQKYEDLLFKDKVRYNIESFYGDGVEGTSLTANYYPFNGIYY